MGHFLLNGSNIDVALALTVVSDVVDVVVVVVAAVVVVVALRQTSFSKIRRSLMSCFEH